MKNLNKNIIDDLPTKAKSQIWLKGLSDDDLEHLCRAELIELSRELREKLIMANDKIYTLHSYNNFLESHAHSGV